MAVYGSTEIFAPGIPSSGAVLFLEDAARQSDEYSSGDWTVTATEKSRGLIICGPSMSRPEDALGKAEETAHVALDVFAIKGTMARRLSNPTELNIVWWWEANGHAVRMSSSTNLRFEFTARGEVRDKDGNLKVDRPPPINWHPSFRYFRHAQTTTDALDAFRNLYLGLESLLSSKFPRNPNERKEVDWLARALAAASTGLALASYCSTPPTGDPVKALVNEIYGTVRTAAFHAKTGARTLLPYRASDRDALTQSVRQVRHLYVDLVHEHLGVTFASGTHVSRIAFEGVLDTVLSGLQVYVSPTLSDMTVDGDEGTAAPADSTLLGGVSTQRFDDGYARTLKASGVPPQSSIREFGGLVDGKVSIFEQLEEELSIAEAVRVEVSMDALGDRYGSRLPKYRT
jgi:hypothetical protein